MPLEWEQVKRKVLEHFAGGTPVEAFIAERWEQRSEESRGAAYECVRTFNSSEVIAAVIAYFVSDIQEDLAIHAAKMAKTSRKLKFASLVEALGEYEGIFISENDEEEIRPEFLAVVKVDRSEMWRQLIDAARVLALESSENSQPSWPAGVDQDFTDDLTEFVNATGKKGRELLKRVCSDSSFAAEVMEDSRYPKPVIFLARVVTVALSKHHLPTTDGAAGTKLGFGQTAGTQKKGKA